MTRRLGRRGAAAALAGVFLLLSACDAAPPARETLRLVDEWPVAAVRTETTVLDLGTPAARAALGSGWHRNEADDGRSFVWTRGGASEIEFFVLRPRALRLALRCRSAGGEGIAGLTVNETEMPALRFGDAFSVGIVDIPADILREGSNQLLLDTDAAPAPGSDPRELGLACDELRIGEATGLSRPPRVSGSELYLPIGSRADFFFRLEPDSSLEIGELKTVGTVGSVTPRLEVEVLVDGPPNGGQRETRALWKPGSGHRMALPAAGGLIRLRFEVPVGDEAGGAASGGVVLTAPRVLTMPRRGSEAHLRAEEPPARARAVPNMAPPLPSDRRPNVLIYLVDTLRADRLGAYGGPPGLTPRLDALAQSGVVFADTVAQSSWTKPSSASILTGLQPRRHGAVRLDSPLDPSVETLAEHFAAAGWHTGAVVANAFVSKAFGFERGFQHFTYLEEIPATAGGAGEASRAHGRGVPPRSPRLHRRALAWLDQVAGKQVTGKQVTGKQVTGKGESPSGHEGASEPFFLYIHTVDPHAPYDPPPAYRQRFAGAVDEPRADGSFAPADLGSVQMMSDLSRRRRTGSPSLAKDLLALYDAEIAFQDATFGRFLDALADRSLLRDTVVVFLSDHGEAFGEHGEWTHGLDLHAEVVQVPWLLRLPPAWGTAPTRVLTPVSQVDVAPTLLEIAGLEVPVGLDGRSQVPQLMRLREGADVEASSASASPPPPILSHLHYFDRQAESLVGGDWKLIRPLSRASGRASEGRSQLFARRGDPGEMEDQAPCRPVLTGWMETQLKRRRGTRPREVVESAGPQSLDQEVRRQLEALGYL